MAAVDAGTSLRERRKRRTQDAIIDAALELFEEKGYDAVTVDEIAAAAEVSPRTFYRYFPTKEDVLIVDPEVDAAMRAALVERRSGETDVDFVARVMTTALTARRPERARRGYQLLQTTPALQSRMYQLVWHDRGHITEALLASSPRTPGTELRARIITHAVTDAIRVAVAFWIQSGQRGPVSSHCERAMAYLREAFSTRP